MKLVILGYHLCFVEAVLRGLWSLQVSLLSSESPAGSSGNQRCKRPELLKQTRNACLCMWWWGWALHADCSAGVLMWPAVRWWWTQGTWWHHQTTWSQTGLKAQSLQHDKMSFIQTYLHLTLITFIYRKHMHYIYIIIWVYMHLW